MSEAKDQLCSVQCFGSRGNIFCNVPDIDIDNDTDSDTDNDPDNADNNHAQCQKRRVYIMSRRCGIIINVCMKATSAKYSN